MATISLVKASHNSAKKGVSLASATLRPAALGIRDGLTADGTLNVDDIVTLFNLPAESVVTNAFVVTKKVSTETTATFKLKLGSTDLMTAITPATTAGGIAGTATRLYTGATGMSVALEVGTAAIKSGEFYIVVELMELNKATGEYLNS